MLKTKDFRSREVPGMQLTIQVAPDDCTGCGVCVQACPAHDKSVGEAQEHQHAPDRRTPRRTSGWRGTRSSTCESADPAQWDPASVKTSQLRRPLFEFSGACAGCGETPYLKLLTQLFGDHTAHRQRHRLQQHLRRQPAHHAVRGRRATVAARRGRTACSRTTPSSVWASAWASRRNGARRSCWSSGCARSSSVLGADAVDAVARRCRRRRRTAHSRPARRGSTRCGRRSPAIDHIDARRLRDLAGTLVRKSVWIVGGDGWAYDIGAGGLDHVLGSGRNVNILVLDTEVYSNTGGQASKATPRGAVAKFAAGGKGGMKKDLGLEAMTYGDVYVARVALGASDVQTVKALLEADAWPGVSLVIAYSTCIAHGFDMSKSMTQQKLAVQSGHWPLYRYRPSADGDAQPFQLDSADPSVPYADFAGSEARFAMLARSNPDRSQELVAWPRPTSTTRCDYYRQLADVHRTAPGHAGDGTIADEEDES